MVRFHLLSLPLPLISHTKQLPRIVTVDICQTQNIFKYNILYFSLLVQGVLFRHLKLFCQLKEKLPFGILWFRPAGELLQYGCYNSEVRRKTATGNHGRKLKQFFPAIVYVFRRGITLFQFLFSHILPGGISMLRSLFLKTFPVYVPFTDGVLKILFL